MADQDITKLKVAELREMLKTRGLNTAGNKQELVDRLQSAMSSGDLSKFEDDLLNDDELEEEKSLLDATNDEILKSPSESTKSTSPEVPPAKPISLKRNISVTVPVVETKTTEELPASTETSSDEPEKKVVKISEMSAKDRLEMRAKKFAGSVASSGSGSDSGSSQDKLAARAARFGVSAPTTTTTKPTVTTSAANLDLLKKRAERFGAVLVPELKKAEIDQKLQKRQERFGATGKVLITGPTTAKSEMEERALKRLERFKQTA